MNGVSRTGVVTMLVAAELVIVVMAIQSLRGAWIGPAFPFEHAGSASFAPKAIAPLAAGASPRVTIDDPDSYVDVGVSHDGLVHVTDATSFKGSLFGASGRGYPGLHVSQDFNGVHISRERHDIDWFSDMTSYQHIDVQVPAAATLAIAHSGGATIDGLNGGSIAAYSDDGEIDVRNVTTPSLELTSGDGHVEALNVSMAGATPDLKIHSDDGHVRLTGLFPAGGNYNVSTDDGSVRVTLATGSDVTVDAGTDDGSLSIDGEHQHGDDSSRQTIRVGGGAAAMQVHSNDGSVAITTNGVQ